MLDRLRSYRRPAITAIVVVAAAYGGFLWGERANRVDWMTVAASSCGVRATSGAVELPLALLAERGLRHPVTIGPIEAAGVDRTIFITFDPTADGRGQQADLVGDELRLPVTYGNNDTVPRRVVISCRDGGFTQARLEAPGSGSRSFSIVPVEYTDATEAVPAAAEPADG